MHVHSSLVTMSKVLVGFLAVLSPEIAGALAPPTAPATPSPAHLATGQGLHPLLTWTASNEQGWTFRIDPTVSTKSTTWGNIKALYRN